MRRIVGLDLNGRADFAAIDDDGDDGGGGPAISLPGGIEGDVVELRQNGDLRLIAGPQAETAPQGRGRGWGSVGEESFRRPLACALDNPALEGAARDIGAAIAALARGADEVQITVPDLPTFSEALQAALLRAADHHRRRARLLWRPIAAFLGLHDAGHITRKMVGTQVRLLIHGPKGLEVQVLTLVEDADHRGHFAPRRDRPGQLICADLGLDALFAAARESVRKENPTVDWARCEPSRLGARLLCGRVRPGAAEVLRNWNGTWAVVMAPTLTAKAPLRSTDLPDEVTMEMPTFLVTPVCPDLALPVAAQLAQAFGPVTPVSSECIALGALRAGRLIERGLPHYYDCLERIAIAVMTDQGPLFEDLIPMGRPVAANQEFQSKRLEGFQWPARKSELEVYILKGTDEVRHWKTQTDSPPRQAQPVTLQVRQMPGQSWAKLTITSDSWDTLGRTPILLDWESCRPVNLTPDQVLDILRNSPPPVPDLLVEEPHIDLWNGADWAPGGEAVRLARQAADGGDIVLRNWARELATARVMPTDPMRLRYRLIGSDGAFPHGLPEEVQSGFLRMLDLVEKRLTSDSPQPDNEALKAATWCFTRCPEPVQDRIIAAMESLVAGQQHPLLAPPHAARVIRQGAGRAVEGRDRLHRVFRAYAQVALNNDSIAGLAMLLARREDAPKALDPAMVDHFAVALGGALLNQVNRRNFATLFNNTLLALAGLFRWRIREPLALLADREPQAARLRTLLEQAVTLLETPAFIGVTRRQDRIARIWSIIEYLEGRGDANILVTLSVVDGDDDGEEL